MVSSLALQMSLYFNTYFFPLWWVSSVMMLQMKVSLCLILLLTPLLPIPGIVTLSIKLKLLIFVFSFRSVLLCVRFYKRVYFCVFWFLFCFLVFNLAWLLQIHCGHCYHPNNLNWSYQVVSGLHGEPTGKGRLFSFLLVRHV